MELQGRSSKDMSDDSVQYQKGKIISGKYVRRTAVVNVIATYIQKRILRVTTSQGPVEG